MTPCLHALGGYVKYHHCHLALYPGPRKKGHGYEATLSLYPVVQEKVTFHCVTQVGESKLMTCGVQWNDCMHDRLMK